ncbi:hypothetical protein EDD11_005212 [Mortierella claussenii]|nr:hypothetical protein EDD11_005212 [Mortierella claussenii]
MATPKGITHEQRYHLCLKKQECPSMKQAELAAWFKSQYHTSISQPTISQSLKRSSEILSEGLFVPGVDTMRMRKRAVRHPELEMALFEWIKTQQERKTQRPRSQQYQRILRQISGSQDNDSLDRGRKKTGGGIGGAKTGRATRRKPLKRGVRAETESGLILELIDEVADEPITGPMMLREAKRIASEMNIDDMVFCPGWLSRFKSRYHIKFDSYGISLHKDSIRQGMDRNRLKT